MPGEWTTRKLADCCDFNPTSLTANWPHARLRYIDISSVGEGIQSEPFTLMLRTDAPSRAQRLVASGDSLLSTVRPNRRSMLWLGSVADNVVASTGFAVLRAKPAAMSSRYLYYTVFNRAFTDYLVTMEKGAAYPAVSVADIGDAEIALPPLAEQKAIAAVLGALDDKIELNRRMNATLEAMARALFQSWFVDFDSVRAKLDGRPPAALDPATAALFPEHLEDSPLGHIPKGWEVGRLDDVLTLQRGFDLPTPDRTHGKYPVMAASGPNGCHDKFMVRGPGVTTGRSGVLGRVFFIHGDFWPLNTSLWVKEFKRVSPAYAFHLLRGLDFEMFNAGSAVPTLNRNHVHNLPVVMPPKNIVEAFNAQVMPLMKRQKANEDQSRALATLRDTLLPKLLSGELSVAEATVNRDFQVQPGMPKP